MKTPLEQATEFGISVTHTFVPFSKSKNKGSKHRNMNYLVAIHVNGQEILSGLEYSEGLGNYTKLNEAFAKRRLSIADNEIIEEAVETGKIYRPGSVLNIAVKTLSPDINSVLACFFGDASAIDYPDFESWAKDYGYDTDSRKAERIYNHCLSLGLKLRNILGSEKFDIMRDVASQY